MTSKQKLILFLISADPGIRDIYSLVKHIDRVDFPADMTANIKVLLDEKLIQPSKWFDSKIEPSEYSITADGKTYLDKYFDDNEILNYLNNLPTKDVLLEITKVYIDKKNNNATEKL